MAPSSPSWMQSYVNRFWQKPSYDYEHNILPRQRCAEESENFNSKHEFWQLPPQRLPKPEHTWFQTPDIGEVSNSKNFNGRHEFWQPRRLPKPEHAWFQTPDIDAKAAEYIRRRGREIGRQEKKTIPVYTSDIAVEEFALGWPRRYAAPLGQSKSRAKKQQLHWAQTYLDRFLESEYSANHIDSAGIVDFNGRVLGKIGDFPKVKKDEVSYIVDELIKTPRTRPRAQAPDGLDVGGEKYQLTQVESDIISGKKDNKSVMIKKTKNHLIIGTSKESMNNEVCNRIENMGDSLLDQGN